MQIAEHLRRHRICPSRRGLLKETARHRNPRIGCVGVEGRGHPTTEKRWSKQRQRQTEWCRVRVSRLPVPINYAIRDWFADGPNVRSRSGVFGRRCTGMWARFRYITGPIFFPLRSRRRDNGRVILIIVDCARQVFRTRVLVSTGGEWAAVMRRSKNDSQTLAKARPPDGKQNIWSTNTGALCQKSEIKLVWRGPGAKWWKNFSHLPNRY